MEKLDPQTTPAFDPFELLKEAMSKQYAEMMPVGYAIYKLAEYDPHVFPAPGLLFERRRNPGVKYIAILISDTASVPALGETVADAVGAAIVKIQEMDRATAH